MHRGSQQTGPVSAKLPPRDINNAARTNKVMDLPTCTVDAKNSLPYPRGEAVPEGIQKADAVISGRRALWLPTDTCRAVHAVKDARNLDIEMEFKEKAGR